MQTALSLKKSGLSTESSQNRTNNTKELIMNKKFLQLSLFAALTMTFIGEAAIAACPSPNNPQCCAVCASERGTCSRACGPRGYGREVQGSPEQICEQNCTDTYYTCADGC